MSDVRIAEVADYDEFDEEWGDATETTTRMLWQLLNEFDDDELLIKIPEWLAEEKVSYSEGGTPTVFVGRTVEETEKAIRLTDSAAARPLMQLAHRIAALEDGIENVEQDSNRRRWLKDRLDDKRRGIDGRDGITGLSEEWIPKSQIISPGLREVRGRVLDSEHQFVV